jgi:hypothetical protein
MLLGVLFMDLLEGPARSIAQQMDREEASGYIAHSLIGRVISNETA